MKKWIVMLLSFVLMLPNAMVSAQTTQTFIRLALSQLGYNLSYTPQSVIVVEAESGDIVFQENENAKVDVASITKLMTTYIVLEAIKSGQVTWEQTVIASQIDMQISQLPELSNTTIVAGERYTIRDLMLMHLVRSSNVASIMLAKAVSNQDVTAFVRLMNEKAKALGLMDTTYTNPSGAITADFEGLVTIADFNSSQPSYSTAKDVAKLSLALMKDYPEVLEMTKLSRVVVGQNTSFPETLTNTNATLPNFDLGLTGVDGLKTGTSQMSGYSYVSTAKRGDLRFVAVVLGVGSYPNALAEVDRFYVGNALLEQVFQQYERKTLLNAGQYKIGEIDVELTAPYIALANKTQPNVSYDLKDDTLVIAKSLPNLYGKTHDEREIVNLTKIRLEKEKKEREQLFMIIGISVLVILVLFGAFYVYLLRQQAKRRAMRKRRMVRGRHGK